VALKDIQAASKNPRLSQCPDCGKPVSNQAESCPHCGRFFRALRPQQGFDRDRGWWAFTIGWGILASGFILFVIWIILILILMALFGGIGALTSRPMP
jgi:hypothetical protein